MKKIILGLLLVGFISLTFFLYNLGQRPDRSYPSFPIEPEKNASIVHDSIPLRDVVVTGNNWDGVITIFDPNTYQIIKKISALPDREERFEEIYSGFKRRLAAGFIRDFIGEGNDQLVDDMFTSNDGRYIYASRPSFADVVALDVNSGEIVWRTQVDGLRADHSAISPDGKIFLVSASTARKVHAIDVATGKIVGEFASGDQPHENTYSDDGKRIYHASIGKVFVASPNLDFMKGDRWFQIVDAESYEVIRRVDMKEKLEEAGYEWIDRAIRPMAITKDEKFAYLQISLFHGFFEYDIENDNITRKLDLPIPEANKDLAPGDHLLNSGHHGIALSGDDKTICVAGTMDGYIALIDRETFEYQIIELSDDPKEAKPYWATSSEDGTKAYVSISGLDKVSVVDYATRKVVAEVPVGNHPQRVRNGQLRLLE
ncbi:MAG: PQQ-binding-like beta-propeller repeat protein [Cytophagales bacterium]|nr:PQQ-binding-like beta-propeller repeat protein [Cytophagales bacterium]